MSCTEWPTVPTAGDLYQAIHQPRHTPDETALLLVWFHEADTAEQLYAQLEGAYSWRTLATALHRVGTRPRRRRTANQPVRDAMTKPRRTPVLESTGQPREILERMRPAFREHVRPHTKNREGDGWAAATSSTRCGAIGPRGTWTPTSVWRRRRAETTCWTGGRRLRCLPGGAPDVQATRVRAQQGQPHRRHVRHADPEHRRRDGDTRRRAGQDSEHRPDHRRQASRPGHDGAGPGSVRHRGLPNRRPRSTRDRRERRARREAQRDTDDLQEVEESVRAGRRGNCRHPGSSATDQEEPDRLRHERNPGKPV